MDLDRKAPAAQSLPPEWLPFLTGRCFDFALALHERMPRAEFVALGNPRFPDHVALRVEDRFFDVRGGLGFSEFVQGMQGGDRLTLADVHVIERDAVAFHCVYSGMEPPYPRLPRALAKARHATFESSAKGSLDVSTPRPRRP